MQVLSLRRRYWHIWTKSVWNTLILVFRQERKWTILTLPNLVHFDDKAKEVCEKVASGEYEMGILICGTGIGMSMSANKIKGIRAACCSDYFSAKYTRAHNDANVLCIGARVLGAGLAIELVDVFLETEFEGGRHQRRVDKISELEK